MGDFEDPLYLPFAEWAKKHGLEAARQRFAKLGSTHVDSLSATFAKALKDVEEGGPPIISPAGREDWYSGPETQEGFWPSLEGLFVKDGWPEDRIKSVDASTTKVVAHTPRPDAKSWKCIGLVVGYVQSGKTTNFTGVIAKMADEEYDLVIVLSGIHNGLRRQTQLRLNEQLKETRPTRVVTLTDELRDFHRPPAHLGAHLGPGKMVLVVAKKNAAVLRRLIQWLDTDHGKTSLRNVKCLIIDDEADQASVATGRINPLIRKLVDLMPRCTFIGYTATPFANVFIDPNSDDLYPKDFILNLPRPDGYFGPEMIFGRQSSEVEDEGEPFDGYDMVRHIPEGDLPKFRPVGKQAQSSFSPQMTTELVDAVRWFWLATAARRVRQDNGNSTMLIHTSVKTAVHEAFKGPLLDFREVSLAELHDPDADLAEWQELWERETARVPAQKWGRQQNAFEEVLAHLVGVVEDCSIILDNSRSEDRLDYTGDEPVVAIAVGGNTLSRGLTLEGLVCSLFVRSATTYDTLLQMGRWFGYRAGYEDLARIWMTPELELQFRHLARVEHEMRQEIEGYQLQNKTPQQVAVRIRTHPAMRITAKMGAASPTDLSYAGSRMQTRYFRHRDQDWVDKNRQAAEALLASARSHGKADHHPGGHALYRNVPVADILAFLRNYLIHEEAVDMTPALMIQFIERQLQMEGTDLEWWSVAVVSGTGAQIHFGGRSTRCVVRARLANGPDGSADIKTLMSKQDIALDMSIDLATAKKMSDSKLVEARKSDEKSMGRGLLVLYPIDRDSTPKAASRVPLDAVDTVIGLGLMFPGDPDEYKAIPTHMAVDLTGVEELDTTELDANVNQDVEGEAVK